MLGLVLCGVLVVNCLLCFDLFTFNICILVDATRFRVYFGLVLCLKFDLWVF